MTTPTIYNSLLIFKGLHLPYLQLRKETTQGHREHQLTPAADQMICHITQAFQPARENQKVNIQQNGVYC